MKKISLLVLLIFFLAGCAVTYEQYKIVDDPDPAVQRLVSAHQLQVGLTRSEVKALLGDQIIIGYEMPDTRKPDYKPIVLHNPQKVENYENKGTSYVIEYYFVGIDKSDGKITDNELTPLVFEGDRLAGWGWDFLNHIKK